MKQVVESETGRSPPALSIVDGMSHGAAIAATARMLRHAGIASPAGDARILVAKAAGLRAVDLISDPEAKLDDRSANLLVEMTRRRSRSEPVSRILGEREFYGRTFEITPATLDPRPDTETVVEAALQVLNEAGALDGTPLRLLDIGTGSGCIVVTLLAEIPAATALATDISPAALAVALSNAEHHGVAERLQLRRSDLLESVAGRYNLLISNPPYIPTAEIAALDQDVVGFDPAAALDGGADGLAFYRRISQGLRSILAEPPDISAAVFEVGAGQAHEVAEIFAGAGFSRHRVWQDLGGHTRCVAVETRN